MRKKITKKKYSAGFSLVEFIVVLTIFSIMSSVSLFNYSGYSQSISETNVAQDIALTIRQAQVYGISATGKTIGAYSSSGTASASDISNITQDRSVRGVYIDAPTNSITLFEDYNRDYLFNESNGDRIIDVRTVTTSGVGVVGVDLCSAGDGVNCGDIEETATITFQRPYSDAYIRNGADSFSFATVLIGEGDTTKRIEINSIGNISVKNN